MLRIVSVYLFSQILAFCFYIYLFRSVLINFLFAAIVVAEISKAVLDNDYERVRKALNSKKKYDLEQPDVNGTTLAMVAAKYGECGVGCGRVW